MFVQCSKVARSCMKRNHVLHKKYTIPFSTHLPIWQPTAYCAVDLSAQAIDAQSWNCKGKGKWQKATPVYHQRRWNMFVNLSFVGQRSFHAYRSYHFDNSHAFCKACRIDFNIEHDGKNDVRKHVKSQKHVRSAEAQKGTPWLNLALGLLHVC